MFNEYRTFFRKKLATDFTDFSPRRHPPSLFYFARGYVETSYGGQAPARREIRRRLTRTYADLLTQKELDPCLKHAGTRADAGRHKMGKNGLKCSMKI